jgi:hypothetical protein
MKIHARCKRQVAMLAFAVALLPSMAQAQQADKWQYSATLYAWFPSLSGTSKYPVDGGGSSVNVNNDTLLDKVDGFFMGSLRAHNGRWGGFTDLMYLDLSGNKKGTQSFTIGNIGLPATTSADLGLDLKGTIWTIAGEYRVKSSPDLTVDLVGGARMLDLKQNLKWSISGSLGTIAAAGRSGNKEWSETNWDGIIGVKGRYAFGADRKWSMPFYLDVGTGQSDQTTQAAIGLAYAFGWGDIHATYRYLDYQFKSDRVMQDVNLSGPMVGATWRW